MKYLLHLIFIGFSSEGSQDVKDFLVYVLGCFSFVFALINPLLHFVVVMLTIALFIVRIRYYLNKEKTEEE